MHGPVKMNRGKANCALLLTAMLWGGGNVAQQTVLQHIGPISAVGLRCLIAALVLLPFVWRIGGLNFQLRKYSNGLAVLTICSFASALTFLQIGFGLTTVTNASFLVNTASVMTPLCCWFYFRRKPATAVWVAALATLAGTGLMSGGSPSAFGSGDTFCLLSAFSYSIWMICLSELVKKHGNALLISFLQFLMTGIICTILGLVVEPISSSGLIAAAPQLVWLGVFSTGLGYLLQAWAQSGTTASETSIILSSEAIFGGLGGFLIIGETLSSTAIAGAAFILIGVIIMELPFQKIVKILSGQNYLQTQASLRPKLPIYRSIVNRRST